jgi:hypothetical protein
MNQPTIQNLTRPFSYGPSIYNNIQYQSFDDEDQNNMSN